MHTVSVPPDTSGDPQSDFVPTINRPWRGPGSPPGSGVAGPTAVSFSVIFLKHKNFHIWLTGRDFPWLLSVRTPGWLPGADMSRTLTSAMTGQDSLAHRQFLHSPQADDVLLPP